MQGSGGKGGRRQTSPPRTSRSCPYVRWLRMRIAVQGRRPLWTRPTRLKMELWHGKKLTEAHDKCYFDGETPSLSRCVPAVGDEKARLPAFFAPTRRLTSREETVWLVGFPSKVSSATPPPGTGFGWPSIPSHPLIGLLSSICRTFFSLSSLSPSVRFLPTPALSVSRLSLFGF